MHYSTDPKRILISGASGFVGSHLKSLLHSLGHEVFSLVRKKDTSEIYWDARSLIDPGALERLDCVIHLSGENIAAIRWTEEKKELILRSRIESTEFLAHTLNALKHPPSLFICASAIGFYGDCGEETLTEKSPKGRGFLPNVTEQWEKAARKYTKGRVVSTRFGHILSPDGGMLKKFLLPFSLGLGGVIGSGRQWMSWIAMDDLLYALYHVIMNESINGSINCCSPNPVTNREFTKTLGKVLKRWTPFPLPASVVKILFGQLGEELLLASAKTSPETLLSTNMHFAFPKLEEALRVMLGREED